MTSLGQLARPKQDRYSYISSNGLRVTKRTSQGVSLAWPENENDVVTFTDSKVSCLDMETELDAQGNWFEVQMRYGDDDASEWTTIYKGYGLRCDVDDLNPDSMIFFRMRRNGERKWGTEIIAATDPPPVSTDDLNRAVEMNSEYLVTRILGNTQIHYLKKILTAHDKNGMTPLMVACHNGNITIAKMLLSCGARVNDASTGVKRTPLMYSCIQGKMNLVQILDQHGADWRLKDKSGCNAMHHAINSGNLAIVRLAFAKLGPNLAFECDSCGWTPLMRAVILSDNIDVVKFLVGKGSDLNSVDKTNSKSILMAAILSKKPEFVRFLLEWGADPFYQNQTGKNCFEVAQGLGYRDISRIVRARMENLQPGAVIQAEPSTILMSISTKSIRRARAAAAAAAAATSSKASTSAMSKKASILATVTATPSVSDSYTTAAVSNNNYIIAQSIRSLNNNERTMGQSSDFLGSLSPSLHHPPPEPENVRSHTETEYLMRPGAIRRN